MAAFEYVAVDDNGKKKKGVQEADSARQVRSNLRDLGLFPVEVKQAKEKSAKNATLPWQQGPAISVADLALLTRQFSTLVASGLPLEECISAVAEQSEKPKIRAMMLAVRSKLLEGHTLAKSLSEYPRAFPNLYRSTVSAGEHSGNLALVLDKLADYMEDQDQTRKKLKSASVYPIVMIGVAVSVIAFLMVSVVPQITSTFASSGAELPGPTVAMISISDFLVEYWTFLIAGLVAMIIGFKVWNHNEKRRLKTHWLYLKLPLIAKMSRGFNTARYANTLAILTGAGVPLVDAMAIANKVVSNLVIQQSVIEASVKVSEGGSLSLALKESGFFKPMMIHMIASGESSGKLDEMLERTAKSEENQLKDAIATLLTLFEPMVLLLMGGAVMIIVMAIVLPIVGMNDLI